MRLEDYFDFQSSDDIRLRGHRIGIEDVLYYYINGYSPEEIAANLPSLNLEEIHATLTYYLHNRADVDGYLARLTSWQEESYRSAQMNPSPVAQRMRLLKAQQRDKLLAPA